MTRYDPIAIGKVESLCINGEPCDQIHFSIDGPAGDLHAGFMRRLSGHDGDYIRTSSLVRGSAVTNWRTWTGLSREEIVIVESKLGVSILPGILLENIVVSGIHAFSDLAPTSRLVFPRKDAHPGAPQVILAVWEKNDPCRTVGDRLAKRHNDDPSLMTRFVAAAKNKRGVMGIVLAPGFVDIGDEVRVYPPVG